MGLDVRIYHNVTKAVKNNEFNFRAFVIDDKWRDRVKNLEYDEYYNGDSTEWLISYPCRTHNDFRRELCKLLGYDAEMWRDRVVDEKVPFYELFEFADNEGCMDWETAKKLRYDFINIMPEAVEKLSTEWLGIYKDWLSIFTQADRLNSVIVFS